MKQRNQLITAGVSLTMVSVLAGCGTTAPSSKVTPTNTSNEAVTNAAANTFTGKASSTTSGKTVTHAATDTTTDSNTTVTRTSLNNKVIPSHGGLATSIPRNAYYLEVDFADKSKNAVGVEIGHPLTSQGAGIQDHGPVFYPEGRHVTVYIPLGVVFETIANGDLFAYFPQAKTPIQKNAKSVWLLMYSGGKNINYVMTGGKLTTSDLVQWNWAANSTKQMSDYLTQAQQQGWHVFQTVNILQNLTGYMGYNAWAKIPVGVPVNLMSEGGNEIFEVRGIISQHQLLTTHPQLKRGIEAASVSP